MNFLIHCRVSPDCEVDNFDAPVIKELIADWLEAGVIERHEPFGASVTYDRNRYFKTTALGTAWLNDALNTKMPTMAFVNARGEIIK